MTALWISDELEAATLGKATCAFSASGLSIDTRSLKQGDLFVALKGENRDGHEFLRAAFEAKAAAALVAQRPADLPANAALLVAADTLRALEDIARASRLRTNAKIVAVTGSAGKTTTKEILRRVLGALGNTHCSAASFNNHWGVPLSLAAMPRQAQFGVFEIGMNHFGEIRSLVGLVRPHVALITTIAPAHLEYFGSCDAIADAKSEIFEGLAPGGAALVPSDSPQAQRLVARAKQAGVSRIFTFGFDQESDARLIEIDESESSVHIKADILGKPVEARIGAPGAHMALNALGALATVALLDGDIFNAAAALKDFTPLKGRGERIVVDGVQVIDESYNANPASMAAALALLGNAKSRRVAVLGDMLELGADALRIHAELAGPVEEAQVDLVFASGPLMKALWDALPAKRRGAYARSSAELMPSVVAALRDGDSVLVKGSNGSKMALIVEALKARRA
jgi:UDP-N-acetylmuramoyl-tripeptide--D-alanyl-D-alanine ligase